MNNEPVAYRYFDKDIGWLYHDWKEGFTAKGVIPLYTHPVKELTDEEILEIITKVSEEQGLVWLGDKVIFPFARAILRKAQEK
jgi:hypothetical protein